MVRGATAVDVIVTGEVPRARALRRSGAKAGNEFSLAGVWEWLRSDCACLSPGAASTSAGKGRPFAPIFFLNRNAPLANFFRNIAWPAP